MTSPSTLSADLTCSVCEATQLEDYVEKDGFSFLRCPSCGYVFCHPRPTQEALAEMYAGEEDAEGDGVIRRDHYPKAKSRKRRGLMNALKLAPYIFGRRALDLGCGGGFVVRGFKWAFAREAVGIDINPHAIDYAQAHFPGCGFHSGGFDDFSDGQIGRFGFVYSSEVIEHVEDVEAYMDFLVGITEAGGYVFITTPDLGCDKVPDPVTDWDVFSPPIHIQFFTEKTLAQLFQRFGFRIIKRVPDNRGCGLKMLFQKNT